MRQPLKCLLLTTTLFLLTVLSLYGQKSTVQTKVGAIEVETIVSGLNHPWGLAILPDGRMLVTERDEGTIKILDTNNNLSAPLKGTPEVFNKGQGGMLDIALHPDFEENNLVYISFSEPDDSNAASTALGRGVFENDMIRNFEVIFRQEPKVKGPNHFGGRIIFSDDGRIFFTMGERFKFEPAQDLTNHLGTIVRLNPDGSNPADNPFVGDKTARNEIWSYGHRNIEAGAIHPQTKKLWIAEMGPLGGDELNMPEAGKNYGWPLVSWGKHYSGKKIPDPSTRPEFADAAIQWTPTISPSGMIFYTGDMFETWKGSMLIGGLTATGLVRVIVEGDNSAKEVERIPLAARIRDVKQAKDGSIYVLTDKGNGSILKLSIIK